MICYPAFAAVVAELGAEELAAEAGLPAAEVAAIAAGGWAAPRSHRAALARAAGIPEAQLFRAVSAPLGADLEPALAAAPSRFVTDPATLRAIDTR